VRREIVAAAEARVRTLKEGLAGDRTTAVYGT
jgi:hypothetical protein